MTAKSRRERSAKPSRGKRADASSRKLARLDKKIETELKALQEKHGTRPCHLFLGCKITKDIVEAVFEELRTNASDCSRELDVLVDSGGGDIDAAYNLACVFRRFASSDLTFIVPRWAKSAATLLVCSGNRVLMSPVAELGPLDPQITAFNPLERRLEQFSPLHIESTMQLIRDEFSDGSKELAQGLTDRLQFPLTLGGFKKSIDIGKNYLQKLLATRMFEGHEGGDKKAQVVAAKLAEGYADHGFCINLEEAREIGLEVAEIPDCDFEAVWTIYKLYKQKEAIRRQMDQERVARMLKNLPPEIADKLGPLAAGGQAEPASTEGTQDG